MCELNSARATWEANKAAALAAINALTYAADAFELTADNARAIRALAELMPDDAAGTMAEAADDMEFAAKAERDPDLAFWNQADYRYEQARDARLSL